MFYSLVIAVLNRPDEVRECLDTLCQQTYSQFEVLIVDGSQDEALKPLVMGFSDKLDVKYFFIKGLGPGESRNYGCEQAKGDYFIFLDSDCLIPEKYLEIVDTTLKNNPLDAFGGPDAAHESFTPVQKAISYTMTSIFTTGGIRGKKNHIGQFHPRGFNMGISRKVYEVTKGYSGLRAGEDIELSMRIIRAGFKTGLIPEAFVYHKRRTTLKKFFRQVYRFGVARINIYKMYSNELKITHFFPAAFLIYCILTVLSVFVGGPLFCIMAGFLLLYILAIFIDSSIQNRSIRIGFLSICTAFIQHFGYGWGFIKNFWRRIVMGDEKGVKI